MKVVKVSRCPLPVIYPPFSVQKVPLYTPLSAFTHSVLAKKVRSTAYPKLVLHTLNGHFVFGLTFPDAYPKLAFAYPKRTFRFCSTLFNAYPKLHFAYPKCIP